MYYKTIIIFLLFVGSVCSQTTTIFTGTANVEDTWIDETATHTNYGSSASMELGQSFGGDNSSLLVRVFNLDDTIPTNANVIACTLKVNKISSFNHTFLYQRACKLWTEGGADWLDWDHASGFQWFGAGASSDPTSSCVDCYNAGDGSGADIGGVEYSFATSGSINTIQAIPIDTCIANAWVSKSDSTSGIKFYLNIVGSIITYTTSENGSLVPEWIFVWEAEGEGGGSNITTSRHSPSNRHGATSVLKRHGG